jgi:hypothetical protein
VTAFEVGARAVASWHGEIYADAAPLSPPAGRLTRMAVPVSRSVIGVSRKLALRIAGFGPGQPKGGRDELRTPEGERAAGPGSDSVPGSHCPDVRHRFFHHHTARHLEQVRPIGRGECRGPLRPGDPYGTSRRISGLTVRVGGPGRNRTGIRGFAVRCITTLPPDPRVQEAVYGSPGPSGSRVDLPHKELPQICYERTSHAISDVAKIVSVAVAPHNTIGDHTGYCLNISKIECNRMTLYGALLTSFFCICQPIVLSVTSPADAKTSGRCPHSSPGSNDGGMRSISSVITPSVMGMNPAG